MPWIRRDALRCKEGNPCRAALAVANLDQRHCPANTLADKRMRFAKYLLKDGGGVLGHATI